MNTGEIVAHLDAEISRLQQVKALLLHAAMPAKRGPGRPAGSSSAAKAAKGAVPSTSVRTPLSREARARIAAAQKLRWANSKKSAADTRTSAPKEKKSSSRVSKPAAKRAGRSNAKATPAKAAVATSAS